MLKKTVLLVVFVFLFLCTAYYVPGTTNAQEFNFEKAYQDYIYNLEIYQDSFLDYEKAKDFYLKNPTLTLKEEARKKTLLMLKERDELLRVYLAAVRIKLIETKIPVPEKLDSELSWYKDHKDQYKDTDPLEDLFNKSKEAESRYKTDTSFATYESLFNVTLGEIVNLRQDHESVYKSIRETLDKSILAGTLTIDPFNRWVTDIDLVVQNLKQNDEKAKLAITKLYRGSYVNPQSSYNSAIDPLVSSTALLNNLNSFLSEFLASLNSQLK